MHFLGLQFMAAPITWTTLGTTTTSTSVGVVTVTTFTFTSLVPHPWVGRVVSGEFLPFRPDYPRPGAPARMGTAAGAAPRAAQGAAKRSRRNQPDPAG